MSKALPGRLPIQEALTRNDAVIWDDKDALKHFRERFILPEGIYLDGMVMKLGTTIVFLPESESLL